MANSDLRGLLRTVRCPRCHSDLKEPRVPVFRCGGCGTTLRSKNLRPWLQETSINNGNEAGHTTMDGTSITWQEIANCTANFSEERVVGRGKYGTVYKGVTANGEEFTIESAHTILIEEGHDTEKLQTELCNLTLLRHPNLVRLTATVPGEQTLTHFCYEYLPNATSLQQYLSDTSKELDWQKCYRIIRGTCEGLAYLHARHKEAIYHLDLSPRCIMLDKNMVPKLQYVSFSKFVYPVMTGKRGRSSDANTGKLHHGTPGYRPPEYIQADIVSEKFDVFSLGVVMINILTGILMGYETIDMPPQEIIYWTQKKWKKILQKTYSGVSLELYCEEVTACSEIALSCVEMDMNKRPNAAEIIKRLNETGKKGIDPRNKVHDMKNNSYKQVNWYNARNHKGATMPLSKILQRLQQLPVYGDSTSRVDDISIELNILERGEEPSNLKLPLLQLITDNFSDELRVGHGGCGAVYKGILRHGTIAVKKLFNSHTIDDKMFHQEVTSMITVKHQNIVKLLGYCSHTEEQAVEIAGKIIMAQIRERILCFEYISNGNLEDHITDELRGLEWNTRYQIIMGICDGLLHLHEEKHIIHMDLKPANILLDDSMVPKITDFGLSRLDDKTQTRSVERLLSLGYCAPEYLHHGKMSVKSDIYSLGVIILEIVTGSKEKPSIRKVLKKWRHRWSKTVVHIPLWYKQVSSCLNLVLRCTHTDPKERPCISDIIHDLKNTNIIDVDASSATEELQDFQDMIGVNPLTMHLSMELNKQISSSIQLTNNTDDYFAFRISTNSLRPYDIHPSKGIVAPQSNCSVCLTLQALGQTPAPNNLKDEFSVQSTMVHGGLTDTDILEGMFNEEMGNEVDNVNLKVFLHV